MKLNIRHTHAHGGKRDAVREIEKADSDAPSGKRRKAHAETAKATNDGGEESRGEIGGGRGGGGSGSGEGGGGATATMAAAMRAEERAGRGRGERQRGRSQGGRAWRR